MQGAVPLVAFFDSRSELDRLGRADHRGRLQSGGSSFASPPVASWAGGLSTSVRPVAPLHPYQHELLDGDDAAARAAEREMEEAFYSASAASMASSGAMFGDFAAEEEEEEAVVAGEDLDLDSSVTGWGDYLKARLAKKSLVEVRGASRGDFSSFQQGHDIANGLGEFGASDKETVEETVRWMLEASDHIQGCVFLVDVDSGWGGVAVAAAEMLHEECPSTSSIALSLLRPANATREGDASDVLPGGHGMAGSETLGRREAMRRSNIGHGWAGLMEHCTAVVPMGTEVVDACLRAAALAGGNEVTASYAAWPHWVSRQSPNQWFTASAALAHSLDLMLTPLRISGRPSFASHGAVAAVSHQLRMAELCTLASGTTGRFWSAALTLPFPDPFMDDASLTALAATAPPPHVSIAPWSVALAWPTAPSSILGDASHSSTEAGALLREVEFARTIAHGRGPAREGDDPDASAAVLIGRGFRPPALSGSEPVWADRWLAEAGCPTARHCLFPTPLPVPMSHPRSVFQPGSMTVDGVVMPHARAAAIACRESLFPKVSTSVSRQWWRHPDLSKELANAWRRGFDAGPVDEKSRAKPAETVPETLSGMLRLGSGRELAPSLVWAAEGLSSPDHRIAHHLVGERDGGTAGGSSSGLADEWREAAERLLSAADSINP
jgi:hypothetical protein